MHVSGLQLARGPADQLPAERQLSVCCPLNPAFGSATQQLCAAPRVCAPHEARPQHERVVPLAGAREDVTVGNEVEHAVDELQGRRVRRVRRGGSPGFRSLASGALPNSSSPSAGAAAPPQPPAVPAG